MTLVKHRAEDLPAETAPRMKALSVKQPWAWAIVHGAKRIENRSWDTKYRGPVAIHASLTWDRGGETSRIVQGEWARFVTNLPRGNCHHGPLRKASLWMHTGAVIGVADLVDVCSTAMDKPYCGCDTQWSVVYQHHWRLDNVRALPKPIPARGALGLWTLPDDVDTAVRAVLGEAP